MEISEKIEAQVALPTELYRAIQQQAQAHGCSVSSEIAALLKTSLGMGMDQLAEEFAAWEAASDEDWLDIEAMLAAEEQ
ncbi:MAG: Arc family DNA-binding protein [Xenococcaceae cyanobacterium]